ncbi:MAG TPA: 50S ribosomal protein L23 [Spirochaetia bacterium]|nr:50S ribosomal protein L23 [Spirochaetia bacterium]
MAPDKVIIAPVLTEKTNLQREEKRKTYSFRVDQRANKLQVMQAIKELFAVRPVSCRIMNVKPKPRSSRGRRATATGRTSTWKKAIVTLKEGERIEVFEGA